MQAFSSDQSRSDAAPLRADARRNRERVLDGARQAFASLGFEASYHDIARLAGVGVGTVYRRYPERDALVEAVLLDILGALAAAAQAAYAGEDLWAGFAGFFTDLSAQFRQHAGLSAWLGDRSGSRVADARRSFIDSVEDLCRRVSDAGLRPDVGWRNILFLAQAAAAQGCGLGLETGDAERAFAERIILDGLRSR